MSNLSETSRARFAAFQVERQSVSPFDLAWIRDSQRYEVPAIQKRWESWQEAEQQALLGESE